MLIRGAGDHRRAPRQGGAAAHARGEPVRQRRASAGSAGRRGTSARCAAMADAARDAAGKYEEATRRAPLAGDACSTCAGRVIALRSTGGLSFLRLRDRTGEIQLLVSEADAGRRLRAPRGHRRRRRGRGRGAAHGEQARGAVDRAAPPAPRDQGLPPAAREVARADRRGAPVPAAVRRPRREPRGGRRVPRAQRHRARACGPPRRARLPRGGDADDAHPHRRRRGAAVRHAPQRARHAPLHADRAGALPEAPRRAAGSSACTRSGAATGTRGSARGTTPSSRCSSSTRRTPRTTT